MATRDPEKIKARYKRYRERRKIAKYGPDSVGKDMRGKHGHNAKGEKSGRWGGEKLHSSDGYVIVRVSPDHPRAFGPPRLRNFKYAYEHDLIMEKRLGRSLVDGELVHHLRIFVRTWHPNCVILCAQAGSAHMKSTTYVVRTLARVLQYLYA